MIILKKFFKDSLQKLRFKRKYWEKDSKNWNEQKSWKKIMSTFFTIAISKLTKWFY